MFQRQWRQAQRPRRHVTTKSKTAGKKTAHRKRADWDVRDESSKTSSFALFTQRHICTLHLDNHITGL